GLPVLGQTTVYDTSHTIDLENVPLNGGILVKTLVVFADPTSEERCAMPASNPTLYDWLARTQTA
ncbi:hypothetical protein BDZ89DRAFT_962057, partial [Hymenopellis radicata]